MSPEEYAVLAAIAARISPPAGAGAPGADALRVALEADKVLAKASTDAQQGIKIVLRVFENGLTGAVFAERLRPFTKLSPSEQDRVLDSWRRSRVAFRRTVYRGLSSMVSSLYWGDERTWPRIGYPGPPDLAMLRLAYADNLVDLHALRATPIKGT